MHFTIDKCPHKCISQNATICCRDNTKCCPNAALATTKVPHQLSQVTTSLYLPRKTHLSHPRKRQVDEKGMNSLRLPRKTHLATTSKTNSLCVHLPIGSVKRTREKRRLACLGGSKVWSNRWWTNILALNYPVLMNLGTLISMLSTQHLHAYGGAEIRSELGLV